MGKFVPNLPNFGKRNGFTMSGDFTLAIAGDAIIRSRLSICQEPRFLSLMETIRGADAAFTQLEVVVHDYTGPELFPAAEAGHNWSQAPNYVVQELKWAGFDIVSAASNHAMDYAYGGLYSTRKALEVAAMPYAGIGLNLAEARGAAYADGPRGRVGVVSCVSSFAPWGRAGEAKADMQGRPGVNPLRLHHRIDRATAEQLKAIGFKLGWKIHEQDDLLLFTMAGVENSISKYVVADGPCTTLADERDVAGNLKSLREARKKSDYVIAHLHGHDFHPEKGLRVPPDFAVDYGKAAIDAGADVFVLQGSHAPLRGIEIYKGKPLFYEPGDFIISVPSNVARLPADYYQRPGFPDGAGEEGGLQVLRDFDKKAQINPIRVSPFGKLAKACVVPVVAYGEGRKVTGITLHPCTHLEAPFSVRGLPVRADAEMAKKIIEHVAELSQPFGTKIAFEDGLGVVKL